MARPRRADHRETVDRLGAVDRVATGHGDPDRCTYRRPACENGPYRLGRYLVDWHAQNGECHDRSSTHGIDVGDRIAGGDPAEIVRVVNHRHEEVGGGDDAGVTVELPYGGIITGLGADQQLAWERH